MAPQLNPLQSWRLLISIGMLFGMIHVLLGAATTASQECYPGTGIGILTRPITNIVPTGFSTLTVITEEYLQTVAQAFPSVAEGTLLYKFDNVEKRYSVNQFQFGTWTNPDQTLFLGEGFLFRNPSNAFPIVFSAPVYPFHFPLWHGLYGWNLVVQASCYPALTLSGGSEGDQVALIETNGTLAVHVYSKQIGWNPPLPPIPYGTAYFYLPDPYSQGPPLACQTLSVYLNNYVPADGINALFLSTYLCKASGPNMVGQLYAGIGGTDIAFPIGDPVPFHSGERAGYFNSSSNALRCLPSDKWASYLQIRVWDISVVPTYEEAQRRGYIHGQSQALPIPARSPLLPPANLTGLSMTYYGPLTAILPIFQPPTNQIVFEEQTTTFYVGAVAPFGSHLEYQWQKRLENAEWSNVLGATSNRLTFQAVQLQHAGDYRVSVMYYCSNRFTAPATLTVLTRPRLQASMLTLSTNVLRLTLKGPNGFGYGIEESTNLASWRLAFETTNAPGPWNFLVTNASAPPQIFFRARVLE